MWVISAIGVVALVVFVVFVGFFGLCLVREAINAWEEIFR